MMQTASHALAGLVAGLLLGGLTFGGLWLTVRALPESRRPALLLLASYAARLAGAAGGFFFVVRVGWTALIPALAGFLVARQLLIRRVAAPGVSTSPER